MDKQQLEALYGPSAMYSEHKRGDRVRFRDGRGQEQEDTIMWICAPQNAGLGQQARGIIYVMEGADPLSGLPLLLYPHEIIDVLA